MFAWLVWTVAFIALACAPVQALERDRLVPLAAELFGGEPRDLDVVAAGADAVASKVTRNGKIIGYLASTWDVAHTVGYSGKPIDILIALDLEGRVAGARLLAQSEPILTLGISNEDLARFVEGFAGYDPAATATGASVPGLPDAIGGATVSSGVIRNGVIRTARAAALALGLLDSTSSILAGGYEAKSWADLIGEGAIAHRTITVGEARAAISADLYRAAQVGDDGLFAELFAAVLTPPAIGQNLLGQHEFNALTAAMGPQDHAVLLAANGLYSFKGTGWRQTGAFDRIEIIQGARTIRLTKEGYRNVEAVALDDAPPLREAGVFVVPAATGFDAARPWRLSLLVRQDFQGGQLTGSFALPYQLPAAYLAGPELSGGAAGEPLWQRNWRDQRLGIALIAVMLAVLSVILVFQDALARRYRLYRRTRLGFLAATLFILGWGLGAQLSVVHVLAFAQSLISGFEWEVFLLDPRAFILWSFVAVALLFWGRGVFCGWLCPFGALQELLNEAARKLNIRQIEVPFGLHERLWPIKYIVFLALFALSLSSMSQAFVLAEVEPFKTAITLKFVRAWPFVAYVLALLAAGLFIERFYCRYLCPLGAALAIPARLRMFDWLKRRPQCGRECRICATRCTVQAIHPDGRINPNECIHCLNCQTLYYDDTTCPVLKTRAARRARVAVQGGPSDG